jgi:hypothetical protein
MSSEQTRNERFKRNSRRAFTAAHQQAGRARYDLNDARDDALKIATDAGLTIDQFNEIWRTIMRGLGRLS